MTILIYADASTVDNRLCIFDKTKSKKIIKYGRKNTINILEYRALRMALEYANENYSDENVKVHSDSKLIVNQVLGKFKINNMELLAECVKCRELLNDNISLYWVKRGSNWAGRILENINRNRKKRN